MTLLSAIERYLETTGMAPSRFGRNALRDPKLVSQLRSGRHLRPATHDRVRAYLACVREQA